MNESDEITDEMMDDRERDLDFMDKIDRERRINEALHRIVKEAMELYNNEHLSTRDEERITLVEKVLEQIRHEDSPDRHICLYVERYGMNSRKTYYLDEFFGLPKIITKKDK